MNPEEVEDLLDSGSDDTPTSRRVPPPQETEATLLDIGGISRGGFNSAGLSLHLCSRFYKCKELSDAW